MLRWPFRFRHRSAHRAGRPVQRSGLLLLFAALCAAPLGACRPTSARSAPVAEAAPSGPRLRFVPAGPGELVPLVQAFVAEAHSEGRTPLVYVGASWCEPCQYFHAAAVRGDLDAALPRLALLELDRDRDGARLEAAGYSSRMIPLFVVPSDDGRATSQRIEGSIHGPGSPAEIAPRLLAILPPR